MPSSPAQINMSSVVSTSKHFKAPNRAKHLQLLIVQNAEAKYSRLPRWHTASIHESTSYAEDARMWDARSAPLKSTITRLSFANTFAQVVCDCQN
jgi:hypothetical protein